MNKIIELLLKDNTLSAAKIATILNISSRGVEKQLARLKQDNVIIRQGSKKYGTWLVNTQKSIKR